MANNGVVRNSKGQFLAGHSPTGGRKLGSRNKLATAYSDDLLWFWNKYGRAGLKKVGEAIQNGDLQAAKIALTTVGNHLPKEAVAAIFKVDMSTNSAEVFNRAYDLALQMTSGTAPKMIEYQDAGLAETEE
jgi:hypothetical protein